MFKLVVPLVVLILSACATPHYTTHYGLFEAQNSAGQTRMFRVSWQTIRFEGWAEDRYQAQPLILESQCSERILSFVDPSMAQAGALHVNGNDAVASRVQQLCLSAQDQQGIHYCADPLRDESRTGLALEAAESCAHITDAAGAQTVLALNGELRITMSCQPKVKEYPRANKRINSDYLNASSQPYIVKTRSVVGGAREALLPELSNHSSICQPDY